MSELSEGKWKRLHGSPRTRVPSEYYSWRGGGKTRAVTARISSRAATDLNNMIIIPTHI
jgi:hypothetical protein